MTPFASVVTAVWQQERTAVRRVTFIKSRKSVSANRATVSLWIALVILVPLLTNPLSRALQEPGKVALVLLGTSLLAGVALRHGQLPTLRRSRAEIALGIYLLVRWLTTIRSIAPHWSLWGDPFWRNSLWLTLAGMVLFGLARRQLTPPRARETVISAILYGSIPVAGLGVMQAAGLNPLHLPLDGPRVTSTQGNPLLLAAYLAMILPLTLRRLVTQRWMIGLLALQGICLFFTFSRSGWLAASAGAVFWAAAHLWQTGRKRAVYVLLIVLAAGLVTLVILSLRPPASGHTPYALKTMTSMFHWQGVTSQVRLMGWQASLDAIRARPWLGCGPATFRVVLEWYMPSKFAHFDNERTLAGRTHNVFLEVSVESGLIGLAAYLVMLGAILVPLARSLLRADEIPPDMRSFRLAVLASLLTALLGYLLVFECAATVVLFWVLAGMAHAKPAPDHVTAPAPWLGSSVIAAGVVVSVLTVGPDMLAVVAEKQVGSGHWESGAALLEKTSRFAPTPDDMLLSLGRWYADRASEKSEGRLWEQGAGYYAKLLWLRPNVAEYHRQAGDYFRRWHRQQANFAIAQQAIDSYTMALWYSPNNPNLWIDRAMIRLDINDFAGAWADLQQADALLPNYAPYYGGMTMLAMAQGDRAAAQMWDQRRIDAQADYWASDYWTH